MAIYLHDVWCLCPELKVLLTAEIEAGNFVVETWQGWPEGWVFVMLGQPFRVTPVTLSPGVEFRDVGDPHYWKAEYTSPASRQGLACRFSTLYSFA